MSAKQVTIYLSRKLTLSRHGQEPLVLDAGRNVVDADVAAHQFVKHFTVEAIDASPDEVAELRARVADLENRIHLSAEGVLQQARDLGDAHETIKAQSGHIEAVNAQLNAAAAREDALQARATALEEQLAQKEADLAALVASMTPAEKPAKGK